MCVLSHRMRTRTKAAGIVAAALLVGAWASNGYLRATAFVVQASGMQGYARAVASVATGKFGGRWLTIPGRTGQLRARLYIPHGSSDRAMLLVPGVHAAGVDEPRLVQFARDLRSGDHPVLTAELIDLTQYRITPRTTDMIEDAALWLAAQRDLSRDRQIGMMGISFA